MQVTKMHALGNNYVYVSLFEELIEESALAPLARTVSNVRTGIGSDGLILIGPSRVADLQMRIFNSDGSEAETCGNGLRCVAKYARDRGYVQADTFQIETKAGVVSASVHQEEGGVIRRATINMGTPRFGTEAVVYQGSRTHGEQVEVAVENRTLLGTLVSMGNPHFVTFVSDAVHYPVSEVGPGIEQHPDFPTRLNVEFVTIRSPREIDFRVWERGSGVTFACGTGACAAVAAGNRQGLLEDEVVVHLLGGDLHIALRDGHIHMTGEAVYVFDGEFYWDV